VEVLEHWGMELVCCGPAMVRLPEKNRDRGRERHLPVIERHGDTLVVTIGELEHPMHADHFISWIEMIDGGRLQRQYLSPGDRAQARFDIHNGGEGILLRAYCNQHGLWKAEYQLAGPRHEILPTGTSRFAGFRNLRRQPVV
jgi:superoxide reductase